MRLFLQAIVCCITTALCWSCNDEEIKRKEKGYSFYCWPSKTPCENREHGIEFSYNIIRISMQNGQMQSREERVATLICCRYIQELIDTLSAYNDYLKKYRFNPPGRMTKICMIGPDIEVFVNYTQGWQTGKALSSLGFSDINHPFDFTMHVHQFDAFDAFRNDLLNIYRKCCLRESD